MTNTTSPRSTAAVQADIAAIAEVLGRRPVGEAIDPTVQAYVESLATELDAAKTAETDRCAVCSGPYAEHDTAEGRCCAECAGLED